MAGGLGDAWRPELHPRDRFGRFRSKWKLSGSAERRVDEILSSFNPLQFKSEDEAANFLSQRVTGAHAKGTMPGKPPAEVAAYLQHFVEANAAVRAGHDSPEVSGMDKWWEPSDEAMILTRVVGPEAFGLNAGNSDAVEEWTSKLIQDHAPGSTNLGTPIQASPGDITMYIAAPKGTPMIVPGNGREVLTSPDTTYRITHVQRNANGGHDVLAVAIPSDAKGQGRVKQLGTKLRPAPLTEAEKADVGQQAPFREVPNAPGGGVTQGQPEIPQAPQGGAPGNVPGGTPAVAPVKAPRAPRKPKEPNPLDQPPPGEAASQLTGKTEKSAALHAWMQSRKTYPANPTAKDVQVTRDALDQQNASDIRDAAKNAGLTVPAAKGSTKEDLVDAVAHQLVGERAGTPEKRTGERLAPDTHAPSANAAHGERRRAAEAEAAANAVPRDSFTAPPAGQEPNAAEIRARAVEAHQHAAEAMKGGRPVKLADVVKKMSDAGISDADTHDELRRMLDSGEMRRGSADGTVTHHPLGAQAQERAQILSDLKAARTPALAVGAAPSTPSAEEKATQSLRKAAPSPAVSPEVKATESLQPPAKKARMSPTKPAAPAPVPAETSAAPSAPEPVRASLAQDATALRVKNNLGDNPDESKLMKGALDHEEAANHFRTLARNSENRAGAPESKKAAIAHYKAMAQLHQDEAKSLRERAAKVRAAEEKVHAAETAAPKAVEKAAEAPKTVEKAAEPVKVAEKLSLPEHTRPGTRFADNALKDAKRSLDRNEQPNDVADKLRSDAEQLRNEPVQDPRDLVDNLSEPDAESMREISHNDADKLDEVADGLDKKAADAREKASKDAGDQRKAEIRKSLRSAPTKPAEVTSERKAAQERAQKLSDQRMEEANKARDAHEEAARAKFEPWMKAAGVKESDLTELQKTGLMVVAGNTKLSKPEMIRRLRTKNGDSPLDKIANAAEGTPTKKAAPKAPDENPVLRAAQTRQAYIDKTRPLAELAAGLNERHHGTVGDPQHARIMREDQRRGLHDIEKELPASHRPDLKGEPLRGLDELRNASPDELAAKAEEIAKRNGITLHGSNGDVQPFDPKKHTVLGKRPEIGSPVQIVRPGTSMDYKGEHINLDKAVTHGISADEVKAASAEGFKVDPKLLPKTGPTGTRTAVKVGDTVQIGDTNRGQHGRTDWEVTDVGADGKVSLRSTFRRSGMPTATRHNVDPATLRNVSPGSAATPEAPGSRSAQLDEIAKSAGVDTKVFNPKALEGLKEDLNNPKMTRADVARGLRRNADALENSVVIQHGGHIGGSRESEEFKRENVAKLAAGTERVAEMRKLADAISKAKLVPHPARTEETSAPRSLEQHIAALDKTTTRAQAMDYLANVKGAELTGLAKHYNVSSTMEPTVAGRRLTIADATGGAVEHHVNVSGRGRDLSRGVTRGDTEAAMPKEIPAVAHGLPEHLPMSTQHGENATKQAKQRLAKGESPESVAQNLREQAQSLRSEPIADSRQVVRNTVEHSPSELKAMSRQDATRLSTLARDVAKLKAGVPAKKAAAPRVAKTSVPSKPSVVTPTTPKVHALDVTEAKGTGLTTELMSHVRNAKSTDTATEVLSKATVPTLEAMAREHGVPVKSRMKKADLVSALVARGRGGEVPGAAPSQPSPFDRVTAHLLNRAEESQPGMRAEIMKAIPEGDRKLVQDAVDRVKGVKTPAATSQVKKAASVPDVVPEVSVADTRGTKSVADMNKDELLDLAYARGISNPTQYKIAQLRGLLGLPGEQGGQGNLTQAAAKEAGNATSAVGRKMSDKPISPNGWGTGSGDVSYHSDGVIGRAVERMGDDKRLDVNGEPLADVVGKLATQAVRGQKSSQEVVNDLRKLRDRLPEGKGRAGVSDMVDELDAPPLHIPLPSGAPQPLQTLMADLEKIPIARRTRDSVGRNLGDNDMQRLANLVDEYIKGQTAGRRFITRLEELQNKHHESEEGRFEVDRAIKKAVTSLREMLAADRTSLFPKQG